MKTQILVILGAFVLLPGIHALAQTTHREITTWVSNQTGSHIGSGYASTYLTNIRAKTIAKDDSRLRDALDSLDGLGMVQVRGMGLVPAAVAWQTQTNVRNLVEEQVETDLSYSELLMAHVLAEKSKESFNNIVALRARARTWGEVARQLQVSPEAVVIRSNAAATRIRAAEARTRRRPDSKPGVITTNPGLHHYQAHR
ncbi:MAG: hypothetical protein ABIR38_09875 [Chthoniobacterales bacterium]